MKKALIKVSEVLKKIFGYGIYISLFAGGLTFFGYVAAFIIGGEGAVRICAFIKESILPIVIYVANCTILLGILAMYLAGELALTPSKRKK